MYLLVSLEYLDVPPVAQGSLKPGENRVNKCSAPIKDDPVSLCGNFSVTRMEIPVKKEHTGDVMERGKIQSGEANSSNVRDPKTKTVRQMKNSKETD